VPTGLLRQRRNLIITSILLIFLKFSGAEISKLSLLGLNFDGFQNPTAIYFFVWLLWLYFLVRYYQYYIREGVQLFVTEVSGVFNDLCEKPIQVEVKKYFPNSTEYFQSYTDLRRRNWQYIGQSEYNDEGYKVENYSFNFPRWKLFVHEVKSILHAFLNIPTFTDYLLPYVLALFTLIYCVTGWQGSLVNSIKLIYA